MAEKKIHIWLEQIPSHETPEKAYRVVKLQNTVQYDIGQIMKHNEVDNLCLNSFMDVHVMKKK